MISDILEGIIANIVYTREKRLRLSKNSVKKTPDLRIWSVIDSKKREGLRPIRLQGACLNWANLPPKHLSRHPAGSGSPLNCGVSSAAGRRRFVEVNGSTKAQLRVLEMHFMPDGM